MDSEPIVSRFTGDINAVVNNYRNQGITMAEVLGALDLIHALLIKDALEVEDSEDYGESPF